MRGGIQVSLLIKRPRGLGISQWAASPTWCNGSVLCYSLPIATANHNTGVESWTGVYWQGLPVKDAGSVMLTNRNSCVLGAGGRTSALLLWFLFLYVFFLYILVFMFSKDTLNCKNWATFCTAASCSDANLLICIKY